MRSEEYKNTTAGQHRLGKILQEKRRGAQLIKHRHNFTFTFFTFTGDEYKI
jgi:hypothetical protein